MAQVVKDLSLIFFLANCINQTINVNKIRKSSALTLTIYFSMGLKKGILGKRGMKAIRKPDSNKRIFLSSQLKIFLADELIFIIH
jgi:hypothetical protein